MSFWKSGALTFQNFKSDTSEFCWNQDYTKDKNVWLLLNIWAGPLSIMFLFRDQPLAIKSKIWNSELNSSSVKKYLYFYVRFFTFGFWLKDQTSSFGIKISSFWFKISSSGIKILTIFLFLTKIFFSTIF